MANEKRYVAQKRQRRRRKVAKKKVQMYEQGKLKHDQLSSLAKRFLTRKQRAGKESGIKRGRSGRPLCVTCRARQCAGLCCLSYRRKQLACVPDLPSERSGIR